MYPWVVLSSVPSSVVVFFILRNFDVGQSGFRASSFGMVSGFARFLARTGTLLGDGDGGRFCAAENGDDGRFREVGWIIFRKRGGNGVLPALPKVGERGDPKCRRYRGTLPRPATLR